MKKIHLILSLFALIILAGCAKENDDVDVNALTAPDNISALMTITQDNSGTVSFVPRGEGVTEYEIRFGHGDAEPAFLVPGASAKHVYPEGVYQVTIIAMTVNGKKTEVTQELTVSFLAPTNLEVDISDVPGDNMSVSVKAKANLETFFQVYFGEDPAQVPVQFMEGEAITHTYSSVGTYTIRVVALSGGVATTDYTETITIVNNPILMPVDFESATLDYAFNNFGGANSAVVNNPHVSAGNGSAKVAMLTKNNASEVWAGSALELGAPINFATLTKIKMKVWSPQSGIIVKMKLENLLNATIATEVDATSTVANGWEELTFNFAGIVNANNYQRIVVFFDFGVAGTGQNFYFDDIDLTSGAETVNLPLNFQSPTLTYTFTSFGGANSEVINNPQSNGINTSTKVAALTKNNGSEVWAGSFIELGSPINFAAMQKIKMKVWSPQAGTVVLMKLEKLSNATINIEKSATTTVANGWEEVTFDFTGIVNANNYQRIVLFFGFGTAGTGATYYFDDITQSN